MISIQDGHWRVNGRPKNPTRQGTCTIASLPHRREVLHQPHRLQREHQRVEAGGRVPRRRRFPMHQREPRVSQGKFYHLKNPQNFDKFNKSD